ncbi:SDR family NAD(P)-dependent oxidoreductase [Streptomyces sp. TS71-3]|uniref:SDR family NAD(P)-dependent oxidoreductase n=1 Tax=Streptomyces sp. TS71-3 TaxID=2733862 RepID=UPI001B05FC34|nr:SDR family oxidoreductase [Streptomyces sp. TS71-3]GHJ36996.1 beta-ketoacyl-ACP reductase [Streptomyces sp. TS71-3]
MSLDGRTALVTGAGRGIGRAIAVRLASAGVRSVLVARTADDLAVTERSVREAGGSAVAVPADLSDPAAVAEVGRRAGREVGPVDILVNNAGTVRPLGSSTGMDVGVWAAAFDVNVFAAAALAFALVPGMVERGWGRVVNVSSGIVARPGSMAGANAYATTKAALEAHTLNLAEEVRGTGVTVNVYRPGSVDTAMQGWIRENGKGSLSAATHARFVDAYAARTLLTPEESAASLVARLDLPDTGQVWNVADRRGQGTSGA